MTETQFKTKTVNMLKKELPGAYILHPSEQSVSGVPDLFILYKGIFAAIELKVGRNKPSAIQLVTLERLGQAGAITGVCWTKEEVIRIVEKIKLKEIATASVASSKGGQQ